MKPLSVEMTCLLGIQNEITAVCVGSCPWSWFNDIANWLEEKLRRKNVSNILSDCHNSDVINSLLNAFMWKKVSNRFIISKDQLILKEHFGVFKPTKTTTK